MKSVKIIFGIALMAMGGCRVYQPVIEETGHYYIDSSLENGSISTVTVAQIQNLTNYPDLENLFSDTLFNTLRKKHIFQLKYLPKDSPAYSKLLENNFVFQEPQELKEIQAELNTQGLISGVITQYRVYPSTLIGLKLYLTDLKTGKMLWTFEQVWDTTDKAVVNRIQRFFEDAMRDGYEPMNAEFVRTSPKAFNKFVCYEICQTLPSSSYLSPEYVQRQNSVMGTKDKALRPFVRFPKKAKEVIGLN